MRQAARDGAGLAYLFDTGVEDDIRDGRLVRVLEDWCPPSMAFRSTIPAAARCGRHFGLHRFLPLAQLTDISELQPVAHMAVFRRVSVIKLARRGVVPVCMPVEPDQPFAFAIVIRSSISARPMP